MKDPGFKRRYGWLISGTLLAFGGTALAQPTDKPRSKSPATKPQVIYHLPASSQYAATLHSQAKGQNNNPAVESGTPAPAQTPRDDANPGPAPARTEAASSPPQERVTKRSKSPASRPSRAPSVKVKGPDRSRPNKSHKK
jgi:hypothetical protein